MSISLSMPISCSLEIPNSAARSWIRVVATLTPPSVLVPAPDPRLRPPAPAAGPAPSPTPLPLVRVTRECSVLPRAASPSPSSAGPHQRPARHTPACRAAIPPERLPRRSPRCPRGHRGQAASSGARSRRGLGSFFLFPAFLRHLVQEGHHFFREVGCHARNLIDFFPLEIENVLERLFAGLLQDRDELGRQPLHFGQRHLRDGRLVGDRKSTRLNSSHLVIS